MNHELKSQSYQEAMAQAEAGRFEQALGLIREHLRAHPHDGEAMNDAGTILFCMHRGEEAIEYLEKARRCSQGTLQSQVLWNLCEAYIQEGRPAEAYGLFDAMKSAGILNIDVINRTADAFLSREALGGAVECFLRSLKESSQQEILYPMLKIVRSRRCRAAIAGDEEDGVFQKVSEYLEARFQTQRIVGDVAALSSTDAGIVIAVGAGPTLRYLAANKGTKRLLAVLRPCDVYMPNIDAIDWSKVDSIFLCGTSAQMDVLSERVPAMGKQISVQRVSEPFTVENFSHTPRGCGKKLAAIGPFDEFNSPVFLLQCMQKLHYVDTDYRLYLAGEFRSLAMEQYCRWMTARLNLEGVVFFEGSVRNTETWLRDKHIVVSSAIVPEGIGGIWTAIACGLRPVVQSYAAASEWLPESCLFDIAEDFCRLVQNGAATAINYRDWLMQKVCECGFYTQLTNELLKQERQIHLATKPNVTAPAVPAVASFVKPAAPVIIPSSPMTPAAPAIPTIPSFSSPAIPTIPSLPTRPSYSAPVSPVPAIPAVPTTPSYSSPAMPSIPAIPAVPAIPTIPSYSAPVMPSQAVPTMPSIPSPSTPIKKSVNDVAAEALKAAQRLRELLETSEQERTAAEKEEFTSPFVR